MKAPAVPGRRRADTAVGAGVALGCSVVGGTALVTSVFGPMAQHGVGSAISGRALGDLLLGGAIEAWAPRWAGLGLYLQPACGALVLVGAGLGRAAGRAAVILGLLGAAGATAVLGAATGWTTVRAPGWGSVVAEVGLVAILAGLVIEAWSGRRRRRSGSDAQGEQA